MGEIISRPNSGSIVVRPKRNLADRQDAIIAPPLRVDGYVPVGPPVDHRHKARGSKLEPTVEILNANPGVWYKVGLGRIQTVNQIAVRLKALDNTLRFDKRSEDGQWGLYASAPHIY